EKGRRRTRNQSFARWRWEGSRGDARRQRTGGREPTWDPAAAGDKEASGAESCRALDWARLAGPVPLRSPEFAFGLQPGSVDGDVRPQLGFKCQCLGCRLDMVVCRVWDTEDKSSVLSKIKRIRRVYSLKPGVQRAKVKVNVKLTCCTEEDPRKNRLS
ncbi:hypothetical protein H8959_010372, partial [Pygathrix nigripes]